VKLLGILQKRFGKHHVFTVGTLKRIAMLHVQLGEWGEGVKRLAQAVEICETYYGREHTETREMLAMLV
jgi:predicted phage tail protein